MLFFGPFIRRVKKHHHRSTNQNIAECLPHTSPKIGWMSHNFACCCCCSTAHRIPTTVPAGYEVYCFYVGSTAAASIGVETRSQSNTAVFVGASVLYTRPQHVDRGACGRNDISTKPSTTVLLARQGRDPPPADEERIYCLRPGCVFHLLRIAVVAGLESECSMDSFGKGP